MRPLQLGELVADIQRKAERQYPETLLEWGTRVGFARKALTILNLFDMWMDEISEHGENQIMKAILEQHTRSMNDLMAERWGKRSNDGESGA